MTDTRKDIFEKITTIITKFFEFHLKEGSVDEAEKWRLVSKFKHSIVSILTIRILYLGSL